LKSKKEIVSDQIIKTINFEDNGSKFAFQESVKLLSLQDFKYYFQEAGLKITHTFGNYELNDFNNSSDRLIIIAKKIE
jgi:hypothetical protein